MRRAIRWWTVLGLWGCVVALGCGKNEQTPGQGSANQQTGQPNAGDISLGANPPADATHGAGLQWTAPEGWVVEQPSSGMRKAQYRISGPDGDAELAVFYFGPGQGGDAMSNATRWATQFTKEDGSSSVDQMKTRNEEVNGMPVMFVEVEGTYTNTMVSPEPHPNHALLGAIVKGPDANWFFKLTGPSSTVNAARADFDRMIESVH